MGGSFNPFHLGHDNSLSTIQKKFKINKMIIVPAYQVPLKKEESQVLVEHRLEMLKKIFGKKKDFIIDEQEITRKGISYSYKTINHIVKQYKDSEIYFIIGLDQFKIFDQWKNFSSILKKINLIVTSRSKDKMPKKISDCPQGLKPLLKRKSLNKILLKDSEKVIHLCSIKNIDISSSLIREKIAAKQSIKNLVPSAVATYIKKHKLYTQIETGNIQKFVSFCVEELENKKAFDIQTFDLRKHPLPFDVGIVASGTNTRQVKFLAKHLKKQIKDVFDFQLLSEEGQEESSWIVLDYGDVVVHIFYDYVRGNYQLEDLWKSSRSKTT